MSANIQQMTLVERPVIQPTEVPNTHKISLRALTLNFIILYGIGAAAEIIPHITGSVRRGFFCDDETIMYPYRTDTVSTPVMFTYVVLMNFIVILAVEYYRLRRHELNTEQPQYRFKNSTIHHFIVRSMTFFAYSQLGFICNLVLTNVAKCVVGRLRPHFLSVCQMNVTDCTPNDHRFVEDYTCYGNPARVAEARKSFFSGHSSCSMFATVFACLYIQSRVRMVGGNKIIVPLIQTLLLAVGLAICYTRIDDNKHHWSDVLVGIMVGTFVAVYTCIVWAGMFKNDNGENTTLLQNNSPFLLVDGRSSNTTPSDSSPLPDTDLEQGSSKK